MEKRIDRATAGSRITLSLNVTGREVLVDRIDESAITFGLVAKVQIESRARDLASAMRHKGVSGQRAESVISLVLRNERFDLPAICDFLDTACIYSEKLSKPDLWVEKISHKVSLISSSMNRSLEACRLFEEARSSQGTAREAIFLKTLEG
jgi:hypothetical protein